MGQRTGETSRVRAPLRRERVLRAALELADRDGLDALSMRKLAQRFKVVPMALYRHFQNKDELIDEMIDVVFTEIALPSWEGGWKQAMRDRAISLRSVLARHPWATPLMESRSRPGPANLAHHDSVMDGLRNAGFSVRMAVHAFNTVNSFVYGFSLQDRAMPFHSPEELVAVGERMLEAFPAGAYPRLREVIVETMASGFRYGDEFEFSLDLILDALDAALEGGTSTATTAST